MHRRLLALSLAAAGALSIAGAALCVSNRPPARGIRLIAGNEAPKNPGVRPATPPERKAAAAAIEGQLKAFKADDYAKAEKYQSSGLRQNFNSPDDFRRMMREAYPQFANYKSVTFGEAKCDAKGDALEISVTLVGMDKVMVHAVYSLVKEEGEYRVNGVAGGMPRKVDPRNVI